MNHISNIFKCRLICLSILSLISISSLADAGGNKYYFQVNAYSKPTGTGKVYASTQYYPVADIKDAAYDDSISIYWSGTNKGQAATSKFHLYAKPNEGFVFKNWTHGKDIVSNMKHCSPSVRSTKKESTDPAVFDFLANFVEKGDIAVFSSNESAGDAIIDNPENKVGDQITMTAVSNIFIGVFMGWIKGSVDFENTDLDKLNYISKDQELTVTVTEENKGEYYAVFKSRDISKEGLYCMVRNKYSGNCFGLKGNKELTLSVDQRYFMNSVELVPEIKAHSLPATVIKIIGTYDGVGGLTEAEYQSQGYSSKDIGGSSSATSAPRFIKVEQYSTDSYLTYAEGSGYTGYWVDFHADSIKSREELIGEVYHPWTGNASEITNRHQWEILPLTEEYMDKYYFGAQPSAKTKKDGKYYTTMYTAFPYKCMDGVKAYIADKMMGQGRVHIKEIESGIVPANTAVLLECNGTDAKENRLIPLHYDVDPIEGDNLLKGEIWLNDESGNPDNYRTRFDSETMRVLSDKQAAFLNKNNNDTANGDTLLTYIANNTCYLDLSGEESTTSIYTWTTDDDDSTLLGDANGDKSVDISDVLLTVDEILGKRKGIFIFKNADMNFDNRIDISDVLLIVNLILGK